jgi:glutamine---fructose-6-phosphate transaminase (isomerizing)
MTTDRVAQLDADIAGGPRALADLIEAYGASPDPLAPVSPRPSRVAFVGLGSSRYAAESVAAMLRAGGVSAWTEYASTAAPTEPATDLTLVAVSASGRTRETVDAARRHQGRSRVIAVTNDPGSPLAAAADHVLPLVAGREYSGIATRTFRATVAVLGLLAWRWLDAAPTVASLGPTVAALQATMDSRDGWLHDAVGRLEGAAAIDVLGDAADAALVQQAALMFREAPRLPAEAHDTGDWLHTAVYLAFPGHRAILFPGAATDAPVVRTIADRGGETIVVGADPIPGAAAHIPVPGAGHDRIARTIVASVVAEYLAVELWRRTTATEAAADRDYAPD